MKNIEEAVDCCIDSDNIHSQGILINVFPKDGKIISSFYCPDCYKLYLREATEKDITAFREYQLK